MSIVSLQSTIFLPFLKILAITKHTICFQTRYWTRFENVSDPNFGQLAIHFTSANAKLPSAADSLFLQVTTISFCQNQNFGDQTLFEFLLKMKCYP